MTAFQERRTIRTEPLMAWRNGISWNAVLAGALAGFAVTLIMTTLGAAIGVTVADSANTNRAEAGALGGAALGWWVLTVAMAGIVGGAIVARTTPRDVTYSAVINGTLAWVTGVIIFLVLLAVGAGSIIGGLSSGIGAVAAQGGTPNVAPADSARAVQTAVDASKGATWGILLSQLFGLGATIIGARMRPRLRRESRAEVRVA
jgi:hypothetical protein